MQSPGPGGPPSPSPTSLQRGILPIRPAQNDFLRRQRQGLDVRARGVVSPAGPPALPGLGQTWEALRAVPGCTWAKQMGTLTVVRLLNESPRQWSTLASAGRAASMPNLSPAEVLIRKTKEGPNTGFDRCDTSAARMHRIIGFGSDGDRPRVAGLDPEMLKPVRPAPASPSAPTSPTMMTSSKKGAARRDMRLMPAAGELGSYPLKSGMGNNRPMFHVPEPRPDC